MDTFKQKMTQKASYIINLEYKMLFSGWNNYLKIKLMVSVIYDILTTISLNNFNTNYNMYHNSIDMITFDSYLL